MNDLIESAKQVKEQRGIKTGREFAQFIGITESEWSLLSRGLRQPRLKTVSLILTAFPELKREVFNYVGQVATTPSHNPQNKKRSPYILRLMRYIWRRIKRVGIQGEGNV